MARAIRSGAASAEVVARYVLLMFALEPEFERRSRIREQVAVNGTGALLSLHATGHPNCWYRVERAVVEQQWEALAGDVRHEPLPIDSFDEPLSEELPPQLSPGYGFQLDVPYVETPDDDVRRILELAQVGPEDTLIDLGSGDGRIVIAAALRFGARGIGIELNPELVLAAQQGAERAGVADRVSFQRRDLFDADLSGATVVTMYLLRRINLALRKRLLEQLRPGARIVSRHYDLGDWVPDVHHGSHADSIYCWRVP